MVEEKQVFLSYSWSDSEEADLVQGNLSQYEGISVLRDRVILGYSSDMGLPPEDIKQYVENCYILFSAVHPMYNVYSEKGVAI